MLIIKLGQPPKFAQFLHCSVPNNPLNRRRKKTFKKFSVKTKLGCIHYTNKN